MDKGVESVRTFYEQGGSIFRDFVRTSLMDSPLSAYNILSALFNYYMKVLITQ